jgi:hypothetical protein
MVVGISIIQGSRDHPPGTILEGSIDHSSSPRGYIFYDPIFEGPKFLSRRNGGTLQERPLLLL